MRNAKHELLDSGYGNLAARTILEAVGITRLHARRLSQKPCAPWVGCVSLPTYSYFVIPCSALESLSKVSEVERLSDAVKFQWAVEAAAARVRRFSGRSRRGQFDSCFCSTR